MRAPPLLAGQQDATSTAEGPLAPSATGDSTDLLAVGKKPPLSGVMKPIEALGFVEPLNRPLQPHRLCLSLDGSGCLGMVDSARRRRRRGIKVSRQAERQQIPLISVDNFFRGFLWTFLSLVLFTCGAAHGPGPGPVLHSDLQSGEN